MTADHLVTTLRLIQNKIIRLDRRLIGRRPHSNDVAWAKAIAQDILNLTRAAINKAEETS